MLEFLTAWAVAVARMLAETGPYLLIGLVVAGFIKVLIPEERIYRHFGRNNLRAVTTASLVGAPLPLCSCSVLPVAATLQKNGASKGATTSFLIATPETGVDSIGVTWALMDPLMTLLRPLAALLTAIGAGSLVNVLVRRGGDQGKTAPAQAAVQPAVAACCEHEPARPAPTQAPGDACCEHEHEHGDPNATATSRWRQALQYGFGPLLDDLTPWLIVGFILSGLITILVPDEFFNEVLPAGWISLLTMLVVGIPLYICATASTPVAAAMVAKGLDPGAALVFLLAGPATNVATISVVSSFLGRRVLLVYLASIAAFALLLGWLTNILYAYFGFDAAAFAADAVTEAPGLIAWVAGAVLAFLLTLSAQRLRLDRQVLQRAQALCRPLGFDPLSRHAVVVMALALLGLYLLTAFTVVPPDRVGFVTRFGEVRRELTEPGLYLHAPAPFEQVEWAPQGPIHSVVLGFEHAESASSAAASAAPVEPLSGRDIGAEATVITGDENLLNVQYAVHYRVSDAYRYRYGVADPAALLAALAEASIRQMAAQRKSDDILIGQRQALQQATLDILQTELDRVGSGLEAVAVHLLYVHAPPQAHAAYRDVASALEDKDRDLRAAEGYRQTSLAEARAEAYRIVQAASGDSAIILQRARGDAHAFERLLAAYRTAPELTRLRLRRETAERALEFARLVLLLDDQVEIHMLKNTNGATAQQRFSRFLQDGPESPPQ